MVFRSYFESVFAVAAGMFGHGVLPACRGGYGARFHDPRPRAGRFLLPYEAGCLAAVNTAVGANMLTWGFPVTVCLVAVVCRNFGRAFWARCE